ncbi:MAG TPA: hypothetical protein VNP72_04605, partial [Longimicrobium sp.]|nr:hypothetical protein [Longimicrobium sp.]
MTARRLLPTLLVLAPLAVAAPAAAQHAHDLPAGRAPGLGRVAFATSCAALSREPFERGLALLHSFWY